MARQSRKAAAVSESDPAISSADKLTGVLALIAVRGMDTDEAAIKLDAVGFSAAEIAKLLDVGENYVNVAKHRKKTRPRKRKKKT